MARITFQPSGRSIDVDPGASLLDAAAGAGVRISAPCGGEGACGECRVRVLQGAVEHVSRGLLAPDEVDAGWVLACGTRAIGDVAVEIPVETPGDAQIITESRSGAASFHGDPVRPPAARHYLEVRPPSLENSFSDFDRLGHALRDAGCAGELNCSLDLLRSLASVLREADHRVTATVVDGHALLELIRLEPGDTTGRSFGLAIDIGTTTLAMHLVDTTRGRILGTVSDYNPQRARGLDIISRINYARRPDRLEELRLAVVTALNTMAESLCEKHLLRPGEIDNAVIAGNTTMIHLLLGLVPDFIRLEPYTPTVNRPPLFHAEAIGLAIHPRACVLIAPGVGSYVGGDITAGLLDTPLAHDTEEIILFLDIGTNGEIVVGNRDWLMACAASAGPAFEGTGVSCGMRAASGAIERVRIDAGGAPPEIAVIGAGRPRGICGSGLIDLIAELWRVGLLDPSGRLHPAGAAERIHPFSGNRRNLCYEVASAAVSASGEPIVITEQDIMNLLRAKASVYSACALALGSVGLEVNAVDRAFVAGGFGRYLDVEKAIMIGMLPDLPLDRYTYLGNSALAGAHAMLNHPAARSKVSELAGRITYLELNANPAYMDEYTAALFLPHTDMRRFPSVRPIARAADR